MKKAGFLQLSDVCSEDRSLWQPLVSGKKLNFKTEIKSAAFKFHVQITTLIDTSFDAVIVKEFRFRDLYAHESGEFYHIYKKSTESFFHDPSHEYLSLFLHDFYKIKHLHGNASCRRPEIHATSVLPQYSMVISPVCVAALSFVLTVFKTEVKNLNLKVGLLKFCNFFIT